MHKLMQLQASLIIHKLRTKVKLEMIQYNGKVMQPHIYITISNFLFILKKVVS